jgi:hypothetical protein
MGNNLWSINKLAAELSRNARTIVAVLANVPPDGKIGKHPGWYLSTAVAAMTEHESKSNRFANRPQNSNDDWRSGDWPVPQYISDAADRALNMIGDMAAAETVAQRKAIYDPKLLDDWQAAFRREHREMGEEFAAVHRPTQESGDAYYRAYVVKLLAGGDLVPGGGSHE